MDTAVAQPLLVELFVEELPPKALKALGEAFANDLFRELGQMHSLSDGAVVTSFASPRRLAAIITSVLPVAAQQPKRVKLVPASVAFDEFRQPSAILRKKLHALGLEYLLNVENEVWRERISEESDGKISCLFHTDVAAGLPLQVNLQMGLERVLSKLPIPKLMRYQLADGWTSVNFVRPAHGLVALHGAQVVPVAALGLTAGRTTQGHRFEAAVPQIVLEHAAGYAEQLLREGAVIASFAERRAEVARQLAAAGAKEGLTPIDDAALLDEVTALVERPNVLTCAFDPAFLDVPPECLILTMKANQKYFPLLDAHGALTHKFLVVSNIRPDDASAVVEGNQRVVRPRLADAKFFFDQDRKRSLESRVAGLDRVVYHGKLGSQGARVQRVRAIARDIGRLLGGDALAAQADRAALLAKADLLSDMVGEFPELQGVMGGYYARHDGETEAVAFAVEDHYKPRFAGDTLPRNEAGLVVALADKLETLVGLFSIGELPTGDRDPFALRRHALGVIRMLVERRLALPLDVLIGWAEAAMNADAARRDDRALRTEAVFDALSAFIYERFAGSLRDQGYVSTEVDAVLSLRPQRLYEVRIRLDAVRAFSALPEAAALAAANKRVGNILKKAEGAVRDAVDPSRLVEPAEQHLHAALAQAQPLADALFHNGEYAASLRELAVLKAPVDAFFEDVMVNAEDPALRANRLALLAGLHRAMNRVADLSKLVAER